MKVTFKGYDPELGRKFAAESNGLVIGRAKSPPQKSESQASEDYSREHRRAPDAQQLHDWMTSSAAQPETKGLPDAPLRSQFKSQEEFEEATGYWQGHVGRIKGMADRARRSQDSQPE